MRIAVVGASGTVGGHVVDAGRAHGHDMVRISRRDGVDASNATELAAALDRVEAVIDACNAPTIEEQPATEFFTTIAGNVQRAGTEAGVDRVVTLSIVGIDDADFGYYRAKVAHEQAAGSGPLRSTIVRATQLHELPAQLIAMTQDNDGHAVVFDVLSQTVAASAVGAELIRTAEDDAPEERAPDLTGPPPPANLADLARAFLQRRGSQLEIVPDADVMAGIAERGLLPDATALIIGPTYAEWLDSPDAAAMAV